MSSQTTAVKLNWTPRIRSFLRSTDELKVVLEASWVPSAGVDTGPATSLETTGHLGHGRAKPSHSRSSSISSALSGSLSTSSSRAGHSSGYSTPAVGSVQSDEGEDTLRIDPNNKKVLAVVSHKDDWDLTEEGCIFIFQPKSGSSTQDDIELNHVLPIYAAFSLVMSQMQRGSTIDMRALSSTSNSVGGGKAGFILAITPGEGLLPTADANERTRPQLFYVQDAQEELREFVKECKRLKEEAGTHIDPSSYPGISLVSSAATTSGATHFTWLRPYLSHLNRLSPFLASSRIPLDLRLVNLPLNDRLSITSAGGGPEGPAGNEGRERGDLEVMRDTWVREEARKEVLKAQDSPSRKLRIRIGTFNVNGKNPSQDLSPWVQGGVVTSSASQSENPLTGLPQIKTVSPLSIGEITSAGARDVDVDPFNATAAGDSQGQVASEEGSTEPGLIVLGFQELDLSTEALIYNTGPAKEDAWVRACIAGLGENGDAWEKLASKQLVGMLIVVLVRKDIRHHFGDIQCVSAGVGVLGVMGNKGASAVRVSYYPPGSNDGVRRRMKPTILTFVNAHLAAFDEMVDKRNADYRDLTRRLRFSAPTKLGPPLPSEEPVLKDSGPSWPPKERLRKEVVSEDDEGNIEDEEDEGEGVGEAISVFESNALFWLGDLNYRIDVPDTDLRRILRDSGWENTHKFTTLRRFDQLHKAMEQKKAFVGFMENDITHLPTYRFSPGLGMDALGYDFKRKPAWTDRILYIPSPTCRVLQLSYRGVPQITMSDHRPVVGDFVLEVDAIPQGAYAHTLRKLFREVDHLEGSHERKGLVLDKTNLDFGKIRYETSDVRTVKVTNTSKGPCAFRFVPVEVDEPIHPEWLSIEPQTGILRPTESISISVKVFVPKSLAAELNKAAVTSVDMSGTLILHTLLGKDHFISVNGEWEPTCFANSLSFLTQLPCPIRSLSNPDGDGTSREGFEKLQLIDEKHRKNAPSEVIRLINWLMTYASEGNVEDIFLTKADPKLVLELRECLDTGSEFAYEPTPASTEAALGFGVLLMQLLDSLPEPVISGILHPKCVEMTNRDEAFELLDAVQPAAVNVWISLTAFMHYLANVSGKEGHAERLAFVWAPILLRDDPTSFSAPISPAQKRQFLLYFIS